MKLEGCFQCTDTALAQFIADRTQLDSLTLSFQHRTGAFGGTLKPETLSRTLDGDVAALQHEARRIEHDLKRLADRAVLKTWLRGVKVQRRRDPEASSDEMFDAFHPSR